MTGNSNAKGSSDDKQWLEIYIEDNFIDFYADDFGVENSFIILIQDNDPAKSFCTFGDMVEEALTLPDQTYYQIEHADFAARYFQFSALGNSNPKSAYCLPNPGISL